MRTLIPSAVFNSIQQHFRRAGEGAASGWERNSEEEDSLTVDLGRVLCTHSPVVINVNGQPWRWRVSYKKFRGRGPNPSENEIGADGIIQVEVTLRDETFFKGVLFQAKKESDCEMGNRGNKSRRSRKSLRVVRRLFYTVLTAISASKGRSI
jgi:hypothetical protein